MRFVYDPKCEELLKRTPQMVARLKVAADDSAEAARGIAPVMTGEYRDSIEGEAGIENGVAKGRVNAHNFKAHWIEFGTRYWPAHAVLRRAVESVGLRFKMGPKP